MSFPQLEIGACKVGRVAPAVLVPADAEVVPPASACVERLPVVEGDLSLRPDELVRGQQSWRLALVEHFFNRAVFAVTSFAHGRPEVLGAGAER